MQIKSLSLENFKAIRRSGVVRLKPLTVLIGDNGSGKSSLLEALETYRQLVFEGVDAAMERWQGFEHVRHKAAQARLTQAAQADPNRQEGAMTFSLKLKAERGVAQLSSAVNTRAAGNLLYLQHESFEYGQDSLTREAVGQSGRQGMGLIASPGLQADADRALPTLDGGHSLLPYLGAFRPITSALREMRVMRLSPERIGQLQPLRRSDARVQLAEDGSNVAEYLIDLRERAASAFDDIVRAMQFVLPYAADVEPKVLDSTVMRRGYIQILERQYEIPGWLMSSGSLRVLPLLALLLDPQPPRLILIEELENGLDPRTVSLLVDIMRDAAASGRTQIIATTHSPYLLDMLSVDDLLVCERYAEGPKFWWPGGHEDLRHWRDQFTAGRLYTMETFRRAPPLYLSPQRSTTPEAPEGGWGDGA
jgi:predicted ATPase